MTDIGVLYTQAVNNIVEAYKRSYNVNIAFVVIPGATFYPLVKGYKNGKTKLSEACPVQDYLSAEHCRKQPFTAKFELWPPMKPRPRPTTPA